MSSSSDQIIVVITGGNQGLGYATIEALLAADKPYAIVMGSRSLQKAEAAIQTLSIGEQQEVIPVQCDIEDEASVDTCYKAVEARYGKVDVLINNAGASFDLYNHTVIDAFRPMFGNPQQQGMTGREIWSKSWHLNVLSTHFFTERFVPLLLKSSAPRILFISSEVGSIELQGAQTIPPNIIPAPGWPKAPAFSVPAYRSSKAGFNMMAREWRRILKNDGVLCHIVNPGQLATGFGGGSPELKKQRGIMDPKEGGQWIRQVVQGEMDAHEGQHVSYGSVLPW